jgi:GNAT superfamily N-acetyltransferase
MPKITLQKAKRSDYRKVISLYGLFVEDPKRYAGPDNDSYLRFLSAPDNTLVLAKLGDQVIGFIAYSLRYVIRYPRPIIEVEEFFVLEEYRRLRIGTRLMDRAFAAAKEKDCQYVFLASGKERIPAHRFYGRSGFDEYAFHYRCKPHKYKKI